MQRINLKKILLFSACGGRFSFCKTAKGFQTQESFENYVKDVLVPELDQRGIVRNERNRIFLLLDNHKSHTGFEFCKWCAENFIELITFYPNATRILQMCDVGMFSAAKTSWKKVVQRWRSETGSKMLTEVDVVKLLKKVNDDFIKPESIINGFRATGTHPFNVEAVMYDRCYGSNSALEVTLESFSATEGDYAEVPALEVTASPVAQNHAEKIVDILNSFQKQLKSTIMPYMKTNHGSFIELVSSVNSQVSWLKNVVSSSQQVSSPEVPSSSQQVSSIEVPSSSQQVSSLEVPSSSFSSILKSPPSFKRSEKRKNYKLPNFGVMTDNSFLEKVAANDGKKREEENIKLTLRNIKKEKAEERKRDLIEKQQNKKQQQLEKKRKLEAAEESGIKKKRGRPSNKNNI